MPEQPSFLEQAWRTGRAISGFLSSSQVQLPLSHRCLLLHQFWNISQSIDCPHTQDEVLAFAETILSLAPSVPGCVVEAGCYQGGSTAKFSLAAGLATRELVVFDSFQGIPAHDEDHGINIFGRPVTFAEGEYAGTLEQVQDNVRRYGSIHTCRFVQGWFKDTLPEFHEPVAAAYLDVDLAESTRTCLAYIYPRLQLGGVLYSQDGHLPLVLDVFDDDSFWREAVGCRKPEVRGFGHSKLLTIIKSEPCAT